MNSLANTTRSKVGLTWIEVVVILGVAVFLCMLLFPSMRSRPAGPRSIASSVCRSIVHACENYAEDYGHLPRIPGALAGTGEAKAFYSYGDTTAGRCRLPNSELFDVLRVLDRGANAGHALNPRKQPYFEDTRATGETKPREGFADGKEFPAAIQGQLLDPWGKQYCIIVDADEDKRMNLTTFFHDLTQDVRHGVVVFSMGKNQKIGGDDYRDRLHPPRANERPDDVTSWE
jgi:hypothetical protein